MIADGSTSSPMEEIMVQSADGEWNWMNKV